MASYSYTAVDPRGSETRGSLDVADQYEAVRRIKEMGLFPTKVITASHIHSRTKMSTERLNRGATTVRWAPYLFSRVKPARLAVFTRQLATLTEAGMPLLRGLEILQQQEESKTLKRVVLQVALQIENGGSLAEALSSHPKIFNRLYVNMVKAGEIGGALDITLTRLAEFMEKAQRVKGKVKAAMLYPCAVLTVASAILALLMTFVVPRFQSVFDGLLNGTPLPAFARLIFKLSQLITAQFGLAAATVSGFGLLIFLASQTLWGRWSLDRAKLAIPVLGPLFRKAAISRFSRTLGTLLSNGVPILQSLTIVRETAGNVVMGNVVALLHENVKQGEPLAPALRGSSLFPAMVAGMVDVGEQTGALPEMLMKIADNYDNEVDNAASALTSLLEPIMIVFLAVVVGSIVIAMFLPLLFITEHGIDGPSHGPVEE